MEYKHSDTFARLKNVKEQIPNFVTTAQLLQTLDHFLELSLDPVAEACPELSDNFFAKVVAWQIYRPSIKFSFESKHDLPHRLFNSVTTVDPTLKREYQRSMFLSRGLRFGLTVIFLRTVNRAAHYAQYRQCKFYADKSAWFKNIIAEKYVRMSIMDAKSTYIRVKHEVNFDDIIQSYLIAMSRAIDRCDHRQGVLTTFIKNWFLPTKASVLKQASESNMDSELHEYDVGTDPDTILESVQHLSFESKNLDPSGVVRFSLGIPEFFTRAEISKLKKFRSVNCQI